MATLVFSPAFPFLVRKLPSGTSQQVHSHSSRRLSLVVYKAASSRPNSRTLTQSSDLLKRWEVLVCFSRLKWITCSISSFFESQCTREGTVTPTVSSKCCRSRQFYNNCRKEQAARRKSLVAAYALLQVQVPAGLTPSDASPHKSPAVRHWGVCALRW